MSKARRHASSIGTSPTPTPDERTPTCWESDSGSAQLLDFSPDLLFFIHRGGSNVIHICKTSKTTKPLNLEFCRQSLQVGLPDSGLQAEARFPGLPEGRSGAGWARAGKLLASQVQSHVRYMVAVGRCQLAHGAGTARPQGYGVHNALLKTVPESAGEREGQRNLRPPRAGQGDIQWGLATVRE